MSQLPKIITGHWDGEPIWRRKTVAEILSEEIYKIDKEKAKKAAESNE